MNATDVYAAAVRAELAAQNAFYRDHDRTDVAGGDE